MTLGEQQRQAEEFLEAVFGQAEHGYLLVWSRNGKVKRSTFHRLPADLAQVAEQVVMQGQKANLYVGCGPRHRDFGPYRRGGSADVTIMPGLWFDLDFKTPYRQERQLPDTPDEALEFLKTLEFAPSLIIWTGGGLQPWWLFKEPLLLANGRERRQAVRLSQGWQQHMRSKARERGWRLDNTSDLARVMRLPGTLNHKTNNPESIYTLQKNSVRYDPSDFEPYAPVEVEEYARDQAQDRLTYSPLPGELAQPSLERVLEHCAWMRHCQNDAGTLEETEWYRMLSIVARCKDPKINAHALSKPYPGYSKHETEAKLAQAGEAAGPVTCAYVRDNWPDHCESCAHELKSPILLGREDTQQSSRLTVITGQDLMKMDFREEAIVGGLVGPQQTMMLVGPPKSGKTLWALDLAISITEGRSFLGFDIPEPKKVLFLSAEGGPRLLQQRLGCMRGSDLSAAALERIQFWWPHGERLVLENETSQDQLIEIAREHNISAILIDPLVKFHDLDENSTRDMALLAKALHRIREETGTALILVHHTRKGSKDSRPRSAQEARGSNVLQGDVDSTLVLERRRTSNDFILSFELRWAPEPPALRLTLDQHTLRFSMEGYLEARRKLSSETLLALLSEMGEATLKQLVARCEFGDRTVRDCLRELLRKDRVAYRTEKYGKKVWRATGTEANDDGEEYTHSDRPGVGGW